MNIFNALSAPKKVHPKNEGESLTQQSFKDECDINQQVKRALRGVPMMGTQKQPIYGDIPSETFHEMQNKISDVNNQFMGLSAKIRRRFGGNPYNMLRFVEDEKNRDEAISLGLLRPIISDEPIKVQVFTPSVPPVPPTA